MKWNTNLIWFLFVILFQSNSPKKDYFHSISGTNFENHVANFTIIGPNQYDEKGQDISVGYRIDAPKIELTQYVYPANSQNVSEHFESYRSSLLKNKYKSSILSSKNVVTKKISGKVAKLEYYDFFYGINELVYSYLYIYETNGWFVKLRITYKKVDNSKAEYELDKFVESMPFPTNLIK